MFAARMAQAEDFDIDLLPDPDKAVELFYEWLHSEVETPDDLTPADARRIAVGLDRKR